MTTNFQVGKKFVLDCFWGGNRDISIENLSTYILYTNSVYSCLRWVVGPSLNIWVIFPKKTANPKTKKIVVHSKLDETELFMYVQNA